jgi:hypothetical protein
MAQILRPNSDISNAGSWTTSPLFSKINDGSDSTLVSAPSGTNPGAEFVVSLDNGSTPQSGTRQITVRARKDTAAGQTRNLVVVLQDSSGTTIQSFTGVAITSATFDNFTFTVTNSISSYSSLRLRIYDERGGGGTSRFLQVSNAFFTIPDAAPTFDISGGSTISNQTNSGTMTFVAVSNDREISGGSTISNQTSSGTIEFVSPTFDISGGSTISNQTNAGTMTFGSPQFDISGGSEISNQTTSGNATFVAPEFEINGGSAISNQTSIGTISTASFSGLQAAHYMNGAFTLGIIKVYSGGSWKNVNLYRYKYNKWNGIT